MTARKHLTARELAVFGVLAASIFASKKAMEFLPNIHLIGVITVAMTVVYRSKALFPLYTYILIEGAMAGFSMWWIPYLYLWTILWGMTMLIPKKVHPGRKKDEKGSRWAPFIYGGVCGLQGFLFGTLYAPAQALMFGLNWKGMIAWIVAGIPFDAVHGVSNLILGTLLIYPLIRIMKRFG